jgi:hypothetical protein
VQLVLYLLLAVVKAVKDSSNVGSLRRVAKLGTAKDCNSLGQVCVRARAGRGAGAEHAGRGRVGSSVSAHLLEGRNNVQKGQLQDYPFGLNASILVS